MNTLHIELRKEKRTGVSLVLIAVGIFGALYAFMNFIVRKEALLNLPLPPMDVLLTQLYGVIMILNLFGIVVASCIIYSMEFKGNAGKKMYLLPISVSRMYFSKFVIVTVTLFVAIAIQNIALMKIGIMELPAGTFEPGTLISFALYSFITSMPVLSFMLLIASRFENIWIPLGIGVAGFLSAMALATVKTELLLIHPFVVMFRPAVAMSAEPNPMIVVVSIVETNLFFAAELYVSKELRYE
ncbi:MAG TPA: ABC transporter permease [Candidatus Pelethocola excrementipullorum]|nr:ABC transporter permease [Candidatus Pelethocola excrementipullorum]